MSLAQQLHTLGHIDQRFIPHQAHTQGLTWLSTMGLLRIHGHDVVRFLQGQLTCDVNTLNDQHWSLGACCTAKGRMVANFVIARKDNEVWLRMPREQVSTLKQHLSKYAVFFKVTLDDISDEWVVLADNTLSNTTSTTRALNWDTNERVLSWPQGLEYWLKTEQALQRLSNAAHLIDEQQWRQADDQQGIIWVNEPTREHWIPQNIDWHRHGGVSFNKGCYTGQEIVARLQYLGKSKKQLVRVYSPNALPLSILSKITDTEQRNLGELASWHTDSGLAIIDQQHTTNTVIIDSHPLEWHSIAYTDDNPS